MAQTLAVMPTYMGSEADLAMTQRAIQTLKSTCDADLIVIDDFSPDQDRVRDMLVWQAECEFSFELHTKDENEGFAKTCNIGMRLAQERGQNALLVNADVEFFQKGWLEPMEANPADVVGALLLFPNGLVQHCGVFFSLINRVPDHMYRFAPRTLKAVQEPRRCPVTGALMLIKHTTMDKIGLLDEGFGMGFEDVSYCYDAFKAGLDCVYEPRAQAIHHESFFRYANGSQAQMDRWNASLIYLHEKHKGWDFGDHIPTMLLDEDV